MTYIVMHSRGVRFSKLFPECWDTVIEKKIFYTAKIFFDIKSTMLENVNAQDIKKVSVSVTVIFFRKKNPAN